MFLSLPPMAVKIGLTAAVVVMATAGTVAGVAAASASRPAAATASRPASATLDHQLCYLATANFKRPPVVVLKNQFSTFKPKIGKVAVHCNPVVKTTPTGTFPITNPNAHLLCWTITEPTQPTPTVQVANQFGTATLVPGQPNLLCLPTWKSLTGPPTQTAPQPPGLSHFTCYPVKVQSGAYQPPPITLQDEFAPKPVPVTVNPVPQELCLPTQKTVGHKVYKIINPTMHLLCFPVSQTPILQPWDKNQFGTAKVQIIQTSSLCLPSTKKIVAG
jgi:hypothetical protein